jgi:hypothetical protein
MGIADFGIIALMAAFAVSVYGTVVPHTCHWFRPTFQAHKYIGIRAQN